MWQMAWDLFGIGMVLFVIWGIFFHKISECGNCGVSVTLASAFSGLPDYEFLCWRCLTKNQV